MPKAKRRSRKPAASVPEPPQPEPREWVAPPAPTLAVRRVLWAILGAFALLSVVCAFVAPMGTAPDEAHHVGYVRYLATEMRLPVLSADSPAGYEAHQPPAYYALGTLVWWASGGNEHALRLLNTAIGLLFLVVVFHFARELLPRAGDAFSLAVTGMCAFLPMHLYLLSVCTNDGLANLVAACVLLRLLRGSRDGFGVVDSALTGGLIGLALLSKSTALPLVAVGPLAVAIASRARQAPSRVAFTCSAAMVVAAAVVYAPWLARNLALYGDPLGVGRFNEVFLKDRPTAFTFFPDGPASASYWMVLVGPYTWKTLVGAFGHLSLADCFLPIWIYRAAAVPAIVAAFGMLMFLDLAHEGAREMAEGHRKFLGVLVVGVFLVFLAYLQFNVTYFQAQARYLFLMLPAMAALYVAGLWRVSPGPLRPWVLGTHTLLLVAASVYALAAIVPGSQ